MPYFVYHITIHPDTGAKKLQQLGQFPDYKQARAKAREDRPNYAGDPNQDVRLIFAKNDTEAEKLLSAPREARVIGED